MNTADIGFEREIWKAADKMRGNIDASEYKSVVLGLIFLKYISDKFETKYRQLVAEGEGFEEDKDEYTAENIFYVPTEARWERIAAEALAGGSLAPTAVLAANDQMALGVIAALENAGLSVPDDVSVVGIDDALEGLVPHNRLTTLRFDLRGVGKLAFEAAIGESSSIEAIHVPSTLVERSTVRDIRG